MRTKSNILLCLFSVAALLGTCLSINSCSEKELTQDSGFQLFYPGISDIGSSDLTEIHIRPTFKGETPSDFAITGFTLDGKTIETSALSINAETGQIDLKNTKDLAIGTYYVSVSCISGGKTYTFNDIVRINIMKSAPEGILLKDPATDEEISEISVVLADVLNLNAKLPSAQITTVGEHISIQKYIIHEVRLEGKVVDDFRNLFSVSETGLFSIKHNREFKPGNYSIDFKLTTHLTGEQSEEGLFADKLHVQVLSAPLDVVYTPEEFKVETGTAFESPAPVLVGTLEGVKYYIANPDECPELLINETTGALSYKEGNSLKIGTVVTPSVKVVNKYGENTFENVCKIKIVDRIIEISNFTYADLNDVIQTSGFVNPVKSITGSDISYAFKNLPEKLNGLKIDEKTGTITADEKNTFPVGKYTITVTARNTKGEKDASFVLNIITNPNMFTTVTWGNNLGLDPKKEASQFRVQAGETKILPVDLKNSDLPAGRPVTYKIRSRFAKLETVGEALENRITISAEGEITYKYGERDVEMFVIEITVGTEHAITKSFPIFFNNVYAYEGYVIEYTPFALKFNPAKGGESASPKIYKDGVDVTGEMLPKLSIDFKRDYTYLNLNGPAILKDGTPKEPDSFMKKLWTQYNEKLPKGCRPASDGSRNPISWFWNEGSSDSKAPHNITLALCYFHPDSRGVKVNPNKFMWEDPAGNIYANGIFCAEAQLNFKGRGVDTNKDNNKMEAVALWFDTQFE